MFRSSNKQSCHAPLRSTRFQYQQSSIANVQTLGMQILSACTTRVKDITVTCREQLPPSNNSKIYIPKKTTIPLFTSSFLLQHHCERLIYKTARRFVHSLGGYVLLAIAAYVPVGFFSDSFVRFHNVVGRVVSNLIVPREEEGEER